jgi:thiamine kinase-like enzyme
VARNHGYASANPVVLRDVANLLVHLDPHPVVARVATSTALLRNPVDGFFTRDVRVVQILGEHRRNVVRPLPAPEAGPHVHQGFVVSLWESVAGATDTLRDPQRFGDELRALHGALELVSEEAPGPVTPIEDVGRLLREPNRWWRSAPQALEPMRRVFDAVVERIDTHRLVTQQLHGDAHAGNLLVAGDAVIWTDFEDTWHGPVEWDLACVAESRRVDPEAAFAAYGNRPDPDALFDFRMLRRLHQTAWTIVLASRFPSMRTAASRRIAEWDG